MLRQNLGYKIMAVLLALFLWFWVIITQRNALETQAFTVPVEVRHLAPRYVASVDPPRVRLFLRGTPSALASPQPASAAYVSATDASAGEQMLDVRYDSPGDVRVVRMSPAAVRLTVEPILAKVMKVEPNVVGAAPSGYLLGAPKVSPPTATVSGVRSAVTSVSRVLVNVEANLVRQEASQTNPLRAVDDQGAPVEGVVLAPARARVQIIVERMLTYQTVPVVVRTEGDPAAGYRVARASVRPNLVTIAGEAQSLHDVTSVPTMPVKLNGASGEIRLAVALALPPGIITISDSRVQVSITIEPEK